MTDDPSLLTSTSSSPGVTTRELVAIVVAATVTTLLWLAPLVHHLGTAVLSRPSDSTATLRFYWLAEQEHKTPFTITHDALADAPEGGAGQRGTTIANAVQPGFVWSAKHLGGLVAAWNLFIILGFILSATLTYLLLRALGVTVAPASFGAYVFAFSPYMFEKANVGHAGLVQTWVFPLTALLLVRWQRRPTPSKAIAIGASIGVAAYIHTYYLLIDAFLALVAFAVMLALGRSRRIETARAAATSFGTLVLCLLPAIAAQRIDSGGSVSLYSHNLHALQQFGARPLAYLVPARHNPILGSILSSNARKHLELTGEPTLFFGWTTMLLAAAAVGMIVRRRRRPDDSNRVALVFAAVLVPAAFYMSLARLIHLGPLTLPAGSWFVAHVTTVFRVYARFGVLVGLGLVILASFALDRLTRGKRFGRALVFSVTAIAALELAYQAPAETWRTNRVPAHDRYLAAAPRGIVAFYPAPNGDAPVSALASRELWFQTATKQKLFFSGQPNADDRVTAIRALATKLELPIVPSLLAAEHVRYVALDEPTYRAAHLTIPALARQAFRPLARIDGTSIYRVTAQPADLDQLLHTNAIVVGQALWGYQADADYAGNGYYGAEDYNGASWRWMNQDGKIRVNDVNPGLRILRFHAFSANEPRTLTLSGPNGERLGAVNVSTNDEEFSIGPFRVPGGTFDLTLHADPGPAALGSNDPRVASVYLAPLALIPYADFSHGGDH